MNREQRRAAKKRQPSSLRGLTKTQRINALIKNGITPEDLDKSYRDGFDEGFASASPSVTKMIYAAVILAAHRVYGFGHIRSRRLIQAVDEEVTNSLSSVDIINEVWEKVGLRLDWYDPVEPIQEVET